MSAYRDKALAIKAVLKSIADCGVVHHYERQAATDAKFVELFKDKSLGQIRGWEITRRSVVSHRATIRTRHHLFVLHGYMSLADDKESSVTFQALCDTIEETFCSDALGTGANWYYGNGDMPGDSPVQITLIDDRSFGGVLCHHAEIHLTITERTN